MENENKVLEILNSEPFGLTTHKAKKIANLLLNPTELHKCGDGEIERMAFRVMTAYEGLCIGRVLGVLCSPKEGGLHSWEECNDYKEEWYPGFMSPDFLYAGEPPSIKEYNVEHKEDMIAYMEYEEKYKSRKKLVWFDGWHPHGTNQFIRFEDPDNVAYFKRAEHKPHPWVCEVDPTFRIFIRNVDHFVQETGAPFNKNFLHLLLHEVEAETYIDSL